jgi:hypothetical protein
VCFLSMFASALFVFILMMPNGNAKITYQLGAGPPPANSPPPKFKKISTASDLEGGPQEGATLILISFSKMFKAIAALEDGRILIASELLKEVRNDINRGANYFKNIKSDIQKRPVNTTNLTCEQIKVIEKDLEPYGGKIPENFEELAAIAFKEVMGLTEFINGVRFQNDLAKDREIVRNIVERLSRYMLIGISISDIQAVNK